MGRKYKIAVIEGDGVGPEIVRETIRLLDEVGFNAEYIKLNAGLKYSPTPSASDEAKWREAGMKTWDTYAAKDAYCAELIKIEREFMKELGYIK